MTTKQYVEKHKLQEPNSHLSYDEFLKDFIEEFDTRIKVITESRAKADLAFTFNIFKGLVKEMQTKFCSISNKKVGGPLPETLWNAFYAQAVVTRRAQLFPKEHEEICLKRENYLKKKAQEEANKSQK